MIERASSSSIFLLLLIILLVLFFLSSALVLKHINDRINGCSFFFNWRPALHFFSSHWHASASHIFEIILIIDLFWVLDLRGRSGVYKRVLRLGRHEILTPSGSCILLFFFSCIFSLSFLLRSMWVIRGVHEVGLFLIFFSFDSQRLGSIFTECLWSVSAK